MKTKYKILTVLILLFLKINAQKIPTTTLTINDVYASNTIIYYGLDFSNFRLIEPARINEGAEIRDVQFPAWNGFVINSITMKKMAKWFKKTNVIYSPVAVTISNSKVPDGNVVMRLPFKSDMEDIQKTIAQYPKPSSTNNKIGMVVMVEYFQKNPKEASAYVIFFDTSNGAIIESKKVTNKSFEGNGLTNYWGEACQLFLKEYYDQTYSKGL